MWPCFGRCDSSSSVVVTPGVSQASHAAAERTGDHGRPTVRCGRTAFTVVRALGDTPAMSESSTVASSQNGDEVSEELSLWYHNASSCARSTITQATVAANAQTAGERAKEVSARGRKQCGGGAAAHPVASKPELLGSGPGAVPEAHRHCCGARTGKPSAVHAN